jgi:hypothetical protein
MATTYKIISQQPTAYLDAGGQPIRGYEVRFVTIPSGAYGRVRIPEDGYGPDVVNATVAPMAAELEAVALL